MYVLSLFKKPPKCFLYSTLANHTEAIIEVHKPSICSAFTQQTVAGGFGGNHFHFYNCWEKAEEPFLVLLLQHLLTCMLPITCRFHCCQINSIQAYTISSATYSWPLFCRSPSLALPLSLGLRHARHTRFELFSFFACGCSMQQGDELCLRKGCRQSAKTADGPISHLPCFNFAFSYQISVRGSSPER